MVREFIVDGHLFAGSYPSLGVKLNPAVGNSYKYVWIAGVVDVLEWSASNRAIDRLTVVKFHNCDVLLLPGSAPRFANRDSLAGKLTYFGPGRDRAVREQTPSFDSALLNDKHSPSIYLKWIRGDSNRRIRCDDIRNGASC